MKLKTILASVSLVATLMQSGTVLASTTSVSSRSLGVDVSSYQPANTSKYVAAKAQFVIVKVSEGTRYRNPNARRQVASAKAGNVMPMAYHFASFSNNASVARSEAYYAISSAKAAGIAKGSYLALDWEASNYNRTSGTTASNTNAILAFMKIIKSAGYKPLLYSGAYLLNTKVNTHAVTKLYPNSLWVASYAHAGRIDQPNFANFPSMNGVIIWQFTDNWKGLNVDGNISVLPLSTQTTTIKTVDKKTVTVKTSKAPVSQAPVAKVKAAAKKKIVLKEEAPANPVQIDAPDNKTAENAIEKVLMARSYIYNGKGVRSNKYITAYTDMYVLGGMLQIKGKNYYQVGDNQYIRVNNVDGTGRMMKTDSTVYNNKGQNKSITVKKGQQVFTYGLKHTINGKKYWKINKNSYVPVSSIQNLK